MVDKKGIYYNAIEKKPPIEQEKIETEEKTEQEEQYCLDPFEEIILKKIDNQENLTKGELINLLEYEIERETGANLRWTCGVNSVLEVGGRYFMLAWQKGLTEYQENEFDNQPYEVEKITYEKTIMVTDWCRK